MIKYIKLGEMQTLKLIQVTTGNTFGYALGFRLASLLLTFKDDFPEDFCFDSQALYRWEHEQQPWITPLRMGKSWARMPPSRIIGKYWFHAFGTVTVNAAARKDHKQYNKRCTESTQSGRRQKRLHGGKKGRKCRTFP